MNTDPIAERARALLAAEYERDAEGHDTKGYTGAARTQRSRACKIRAGQAELHAVRAIAAALTTESRPEVEALKREREGCARTAQRYVAAAGSMTNEETARGVMQAIRDRPVIASPHPQTNLQENLAGSQADAPASGEVERLRQALENAKLQLVYLDGDKPKHGTTAGVLAQIDYALQSTPTPSEGARDSALEEAAKVADKRARMAAEVSHEAARALLAALPDAIRALRPTKPEQPDHVVGFADTDVEQPE